jgi:hypothetical protein
MPMRLGLMVQRRRQRRASMRRSKPRQRVAEAAEHQRRREAALRYQPHVVLSQMAATTRSPARAGATEQHLEKYWRGAHDRSGRHIVASFSLSSEKL